MKAATLVSLLGLLSATAAAEEPVRPRPSEKAAEAPAGRTPAVLAGVPSATVNREPTLAAITIERSSAKDADELRQLGDLKTLDLREGEAIVRVDGAEQTLRPGMRLKGDLVRSISPQRIVLVRPEGVDAKKGETLIVVDILGAGRNRVRVYAARDWTATPPRTAE
jgi:hypothetical protein